MQKPLDDRLRDDVISELAWDRNIEAQGISVSARHGVITLGGFVTSYAQKIHAAEAAHRVAGVLDVANDIAVRTGSPDETSDPELAEKIRIALAHDTLSHTHIKTTVANGVVFLTGQAASTEERVRISKLVRELAGVRGVVDEMRVDGEALQVEQVAREIRSAFERHARRDSDHVAIEIRDGVATLTGAVHSWAERQVVVGAARGTRGVLDVVDRLQVDPYNTHH